MGKVALYRCSSREVMTGKVGQIISDLGTEKISALFRQKKVLLKPNLCIDFPPEKGATTHPALIDAVISFAKDFGARVTVGDGPIVGVKGKVFEITGAAEICRKHGVPLVNLNHQRGRYVRLNNALAWGEALVADAYFESDTIVNLPVFKSNTLYWLSGALKNMKGFLVGKEKHKPHELGVPQCVADLNVMLKQDLVIMDGFMGMMGNGPAAGKPARAGLLIGGFDPVAVDAVAAVLMGFNPEKIPMIREAEKAGVGLSHCEITGDPVDSFRINFEKPLIARASFGGGFFDWIQKIVFGAVIRKSRVDVDPARCTLCGNCKTACPANAVIFNGNTIEIDPQKCDICLCCHEACPGKAIEIKGLLSRTDAFLRSK